MRQHLHLPRVFHRHLAAQLSVKRYHAVVYWLVVVATTTVGTTTSDYLDRTAGLGYIKSSIGLFCGVIAVLVAWRLTTGEIVADRITNRRNETFYWLTILVSNTLERRWAISPPTTQGWASRKAPWSSLA